MLGVAGKKSIESESSRHSVKDFVQARNMSEGPDQILPSDGYVTTDASGSVKLRTGEKAPDNYEPVSVPTLLKRAVSTGGNHLALVVKREGKHVKWTYKEYLKGVETVAKGFIKLGLKPRHGVAIIGFNSPEWFFSDLGAVFADGMATGIYPTSSSESCKFILENCRANILVAEDEAQLAKILPFRDELPELKAIIQYTGKSSTAGVISWNDFMKIGESQSDEELQLRLKNIAINQCCHLVYTSGTTGRPKAVMLSHDNLTFTARQMFDVFHLKEKEERLVSYLPLSHVAANICDIFVVLTAVGTVYFANKDALKGTLTTTLQEALPTFIFGVPRVWEKIREKMLEVGRQNKGLKRTIGNWAKKTGLEHNLRILNGEDRTSLKYMIANKVIFQKVKTALGLNKCHLFLSGAAPMSYEVLEYFLSLDIRIFEIYGMSESSGPHMSNTHENRKLGTIGKELSGFHNKILGKSSEGGEICAKGRHVMMGYLFNEEKTNEVLDDDGWLRTGDVGEIDDDGFVTITGRLKEIIITAGGENIPPAAIEDAIKKELPCISNVVLIGDRRKFLSCLLTLKVDIDPDSMEPQDTLSPIALAWCEDIGSVAKTVGEALVDNIVAKAIQDGVDRANLKAASNAQKVQKWIVLPKDFSIPGGELGPTMKIKRHFVLEKYLKNIDDFYK